MTTAAYPHVGQRVRCTWGFPKALASQALYNDPSWVPTVGEIYTIGAIDAHCCGRQPGKLYLLFVEHRSSIGMNFCCRRQAEHAWDAGGFVPLGPGDEAMELLRKVARDAGAFGGMTVPDDAPKRISERRRKPGRVKA